MNIGSEPESAGSYAIVTAEQLTLLYLRDTEVQLTKSDEQPIRLAQAAKSLHHALQAALTAALAGNMGIGAYSDKTEREWLRFLQGGATVQPSDRVLSLEALLDKATSKTLKWTRQPLAVTIEERERITTLDWVRDRIEHPRPGFWMIEPAFIHRLLSPAAGVCGRCVEAVRHHFKEEEVRDVERITAWIEARYS